jgi:hypothetical protein
MLAFRSEVHVDRRSEATGMPRGCAFGLEQAWGLGRDWYADRLSPDWRRATPEEAEATFAGLGLSGDFWRLT